jgi:hypothetical protein
MRNIGDIKGGNRKDAATSNRKGSTINSENMKRKLKRAKRGQRRRVKSNMKGNSRIQDPQICTRL